LTATAFEYRVSGDKHQTFHARWELAINQQHFPIHGHPVFDRRMIN